MCGIVGAAAQRNVVPILIEGLRKLEYRGYDSAGIALNNGDIQRIRSVGRVADLQARADQEGAQAPTGIAHTRWATHGGVNEANAHPHASSGHGASVSVVHNGIIENHEVLRNRLIEAGYQLVLTHGNGPVVGNILYRMARTADGRSALVEMKAVDGAYPMLGDLKLEPQLSLPDLIAPQHGAFGAAADAALDLMSPRKLRSLCASTLR